MAGLQRLTNGWLIEIGQWLANIEVGKWQASRD
jgi:hypothetical protein